MGQRLPVGTELPKYIIVGRGRWAPRIQAILDGEKRVTARLEQSRRDGSEEDAAYRGRLKNSFKGCGADIAWLCVTPGPHVSVMIEAALEAGLHVVVEKPWLCSEEETDRLAVMARSRGCVVGIHYEYCLLDAIQEWKRDWNQGDGLRFGGRMCVERPNHSGLTALDNFGSHLFSVHEYCVARSEILEIDCAYQRPDERRVWLDKGNQRKAEIDFLANREPIIQRFIARMETAAAGRTDFPFDLQFALRVAEQSKRWRRVSLAGEGR